MGEFYIANRLSHSDMARVVPGVRRLNQKLADTLRSVALKRGVAKTQAGRRLEFYSVSQAELNELIEPATATLITLKNDLDWNPLLTVDADIMSKNLTEVNSRYTRRMDYKTAQQYNKDLQAALDASVVVIGQDHKKARTRHTNPGYKVGDFLSHSAGYRETYPAVITKITESGYQYQVYQPAFYVPWDDTVKAWAKQFKNAEAWGNAWDGNVKIPFEPNQKWFKLNPKKYNRRFTKYDQARLDNGLAVRTIKEAYYNSYWYMD